MITVFIGTFNRLETLVRTVNSYARLATPHELVIVDNGSDNKQCKALLKQMVKDKRVKKVYNLPGCMGMEEATDNFNIAIRDQYEGSGGEWFAVTEADVCFEGSDPESLNAYLEVAKATGRATGPHLRVDKDIPASYPLRTRVLTTESRLLYIDQMRWLDEWIPYTDCQIDTTFHLFPRTRFFNRLHLNPIRVGPPFTAMHLDWYLNIFAPNEENTIYLPGTRPIGSWGKSWIQDFWQNFQVSPDLAYERLLADVRNPSDLDNNSFMLSWCHQYGHGVPIDLDASARWIDSAIPHGTIWRDYRKDWMPMVYENDFSSLGWE